MSDGMVVYEQADSPWNRAGMVAWRLGVVCVIGVSACGFPRPADVGDDAGSSDAAGSVDASTADGLVAPPTITAFSPDWGSTSGGTQVRMLGFGFTGSHLAVKFGPSIASQVTVLSDSELTVTTPSGPHMPVDVAVTTDGGTATATARYRYLAPLYAADARGTTPGNLYIVNPATAASVSVGPLGVAVTGLALSPGGVLYGATAIKASGNTLVTIDPYTARVTTIGPLVDQVNAGVTVPDLAFEGSRLLGWTGPSFAVIDSVTGRVTPYTAQTGIGGGRGLASIAPGTLLLAQGTNLSRVNTTDGTLVLGPSLPKLGMNSLTFVGGTLCGSEPTSVTPPLTALVTIDPATGAITVIGPLPPRVDAIAGIPPQPAQGAAATLPAQMAPASPRPIDMMGQAGAQTPHQPTLRIGDRSRALHEVLALAREVTDSGRVRRILPLAALAAFGLGDRVVLVAASGATRVVALGAPGLALTVNHRQELKLLKLIDTRDGFQQIFAAIVEVRDLTHR
ncbi:MAG TPA: IPT/TIG domain-containing protein [Kofleriaceae bacterium]